MRLIQKINIRFFLWLFVMLILLSFTLIYGLKQVLKEEVDEKLEFTYKHAVNLIKSNQSPALFEPFIIVEQVDEAKKKKEYSYVLIEDIEDKFKKKKEGKSHGHYDEVDLDEYRQLVVIKKINGIFYKITVRESLLEMDDLFEEIGAMILIGFFMLFGLLFYINNKISKSVWRPFYDNLERLKKFSLKKLAPFNPLQTNTREFSELNKGLVALTNKVLDDYGILKKFSEDAAHELQTPLAVIRSKIENLLEENNLNSSQAEKIQAIYTSTNRLTRINKDLLLLAKIENSQFEKLERLNFDMILKEKMNHFSELIEISHINLEYYFISDWSIQADKSLVDVLLNNLISNAIKHNKESGIISITLNKGNLLIANSGDRGIINQDKMFNRFYKESKSNSTGLGLAICSQICSALSLKISYNYSENNHNFTLTQ